MDLKKIDFYHYGAVGNWGIGPNFGQMWVVKVGHPF